MIKSTGFRSVSLRGKPRRKKSPYQGSLKRSRSDSLFMSMYPHSGESFWFDSKIVRFVPSEYKARYGYSKKLL